MRKSILFFSLSLVAFSSSAFANSQYFLLNSSFANILKKAQFCDLTTKAAGFPKEAEPNGTTYQMSFDPNSDSFNLTAEHITFVVYRGVPYAFVNDPSADTSSLKPLMVRGQTFTGVRMDFSGFSSSSVFCYYMN